MALLLSNIRMPIQADVQEIPALIADSFGIPKESIQAVRLVRQSLDARKKNDIHFMISAVVQMEPIWQARLMKREDLRVQLFAHREAYHLPEGKEKPEGRVAVAGMGPAGMFAAYFLAQAGYAPLLIERGRPVERRAQDVERFWQGGGLDKTSNVMFGEGGAGAFSDGKLTSRSKDPRAEIVLRTLIEHGAPEDIAFMAKPHIGTDLLQAVMKQMRAAILRMGGEVMFETKLHALDLKNERLDALRLQRGEAIERVPCAACVLATGQAARDTYKMLLEAGLVLQPKPFAMGVRIEHPQAMIDAAQFGALAGDPRLGAAEYRMAAKAGGRGVYTFCMCPGGLVIAASSGEEEVVTNGMSLRARNGGNANAAIVVQVGPEDFGYEPLSGVLFQMELEKRAFQAGVGAGPFHAPAQRLADYLAGQKTKSFGGIEPTYKPGVVPHRLDTLLPEYIAAGVRQSITAFDRQMKGFALPDAVLTAVESRTSSPVRILRDERGEAVNAHGVYPAGEGAGYAGGIVSAAMDGMRAAEQIAARYAAQK